MTPEQDYAAAVSALLKLAVNLWTVGASLVIFLLTGYCGRFLEATGSIRAITVWRKALPVFPETVAILVALLGGLPPVASSPWEVRLAVGLAVGRMTTWARELLGKTILGDDERLDRALAAVLTRPEKPADAPKGEGKGP